MALRYTGFFSAAILLCLAAVDGASATIDEFFPLAAWMEVSPVAERMTINGLPSQVYSFTAEKDVEATLDFFRNRWKGRGKGCREADVEYWRVLSRLESGLLLTVQVREKDRFSAEGYLAVADLRRAGKNSNDLSVPAMHGSRVIHTTLSEDYGKKATTVLIVNPFSVATNSDFYRNHFRGRGWGAVMDEGGDGAKVLVYGKGDHSAHLVLDGDGDITRIVMNLEEAN